MVGVELDGVADDIFGVLYMDFCHVTGSRDIEDVLYIIMPRRAVQDLRSGNVI